MHKATNFLIHTKAHGCVNCHGLWREREKKLAAIKELYDIIDTEVRNTHTYYHVRCKSCGHERTTSLKNLISHLECGCTTGVYRGRNAEEFIAQVNKSSTIGPYELISEYKDQTTQVLLRHLSCGFIWKVRPSDVVNGHSGCPKCRKCISKGESLVLDTLDKLGIPYESQKPLDGTKQRFDAYIDFNGYKVAIEYNGIQHYKEVPIFSSTLEETQERDERKRAWCKEHGVELIELPYTLSKDEIVQILQELANKLNDYPEGE